MVAARHRVEHRLPSRHEQQRDVAKHDVELKEHVLPADDEPVRVLDEEQDRHAADCRDDRRQQQRHVQAHERAACAGGIEMEDQAVVEHEDERKHRRDFFAGERRNPADHGEDPPRRPAAEHPAAAAEQREQEERAAQQLGPPGHVADGLRHHRVRGKDQRRTKADDNGLFRDLGEPRSLAIRDDPGRHLEQQHDVEHVQQQVRQVKAERVQAPDGVVHCVREVDERPRRFEQDDRTEIGEVLDAGVLDDHSMVVINKRIRQRVEV